nr:DMT family transporter [Glycomyces albidus]
MTDRMFAAGFVVAWSGGFIGIEIGTRDAPAPTLLAWRFLVLAVPAALWLWWRLRRRSLPSRRHLGVHVAVALLAQVGYLAGIGYAAQLGVAPGLVSLIAALQPIVMAVAASRFLGQPATKVQIVGLAVGLAGVGLVVWADAGGGTAPLWAFALPYAAVVSIVTGTVIERREDPDDLGQTEALALHFLVAAVVFGCLSAATGTLEPPMTADFWTGVAWTVVFAGIGGYGLYWAVVHRSGATTASGLLYLTPPTTMLWAWLMFGDELHSLSWAGLAVVAIGVALALRGRPHADRDDREPQPAEAADPA